MPKIRAPKSHKTLYKILNTLFFLIRTSCFGAEAERFQAYTVLGCAGENTLKMFLNSVTSSCEGSHRTL